MARDEERLERAGEEPIVGGLPDVPGIGVAMRLKPELGVPSLYYATHLDVTGERLADDDYAALHVSWERWRST